MAEGFFNSAVKNDPLLSDKFIASSAGIMPISGSPPSDHSQAILKNKWGINLDYHKAKLIEYGDIEDAHLILTMTRKHKEAIMRMFPRANSKIYTLREFADGKISGKTFAENVANNYNFSLDILDPYGMSLEVYKQSANDIKDAVDKIITELRKKIAEDKF